MDADEKLTELKKAYANMILNTTKEAAARIMMSERITHRLELELKDSKENALHMLTRLKQMMDFKINEAEMASQTQQKKIAELEAQLEEAEDIVNHLREELSALHAELERAKPKKEVNPYSIPTSDVQNSDKDQSNNGQTLYNSLFPFRKSYINDQNLPTIILRSKGRKLYRSSCSTHRIHACEGNPCEQTNVINPDLLTKAYEEGEKLHKEPSLGDEREKCWKRPSPNRNKRTTCPTQPLDQVEDFYHVANDSYSTTARSTKRSKMEDYDASINIVTGLVRVSDAFKRIIKELLPMGCDKTELPLTAEAPKSKAVETDGVGVPIYTTSGRIIKYTYQRRRKRGTLKTNESDLGNNMKKKEADKHAISETEKVSAVEKSTQEETEKVKSIGESTLGEKEKVISMEESTQEETDLEKVAKQRITLFTKKW